jgi:hypothetical protein
MEIRTSRSQAEQLLHAYFAGLKARSTSNVNASTRCVFACAWATGTPAVNKALPIMAETFVRAIRMRVVAVMVVTAIAIAVTMSMATWPFAVFAIEDLANRTASVTGLLAACNFMAYSAAVEGG